MLGKGMLPGFPAHLFAFSFTTCPRRAPEISLTSKMNNLWIGEWGEGAVRTEILGLQAEFLIVGRARTDFLSPGIVHRKK